MNQLLFLTTLFCDLNVIIWFAVIFHGALYRKINNNADRNLRTANSWHLCRTKNSQQIIFLKPHENFYRNRLKKTKKQNPHEIWFSEHLFKSCQKQNFF